MKKLVFTLLFFLGLSYGFSLEEFLWIFYWNDYDYYLWKEDREAYVTDFTPRPFTNEKIIPMPVLTEEYPHAAVQLDRLVADAMKKHRSLDWALVNLKPSIDPAASLPDSVRRCMLYYLYHDNFSKVERPWNLGDNNFSIYYSGGTGTLEQGWVRYASISVWTMDAGVAFFDGYTGISWSRTGDTVMDSARTMRMFNDALQKNVLISPLSNPAWSSIANMDSCTFHERYQLSAYCLEVPFEYDCCEEYPELYRKVDTLFLAAFVADDYEYLVFSSYGPGRRIHPWNFYLRFRP